MGSDRRGLSGRRRRGTGASLPRALRAACIAVAAAAAAAGCTTQQVYSSMQAWQRNACNRLVEETERERCLGSTAMSYDDYKRRTGDGSKP